MSCMFICVFYTLAPMSSFGQEGKSHYVDLQFACILVLLQNEVVDVEIMVVSCLAAAP